METANKSYSTAERAKLFRKVEGTRYTRQIIEKLNLKGISSNPGYLRWAFHTKSGDNVVYEALEELVAERKLLSKRPNIRVKKGALRLADV